MILVDTNIFADLVDDVGRWSEWSKRAIEAAALDNALAINHIILAELYGRAESAQAFARLQPLLGIAILPLNDAIAERAGTAFGRYRAIGGPRTSILPDFLIGAHAVTLRAALLTRDHDRFAYYFPELTLITPETAP